MMLERGNDYLTDMGIILIKKRLEFLARDAEKEVETEFELVDTFAEQFSYEAMMRQFVYDNCPDADGEEFDEVMDELRQLGKIAIKDAKS